MAFLLFLYYFIYYYLYLLLLPVSLCPQVRYAYCSETCGRSPCKTCEDVQPTSEYNCTMQAQFGKCGESWMIEVGAGGVC